MNGHEAGMKMKPPLSSHEGSHWMGQSATFKSYFQPLEHKGMSCGTLNNVGSSKIKSQISNVLLAQSF